MRAMSMIVDMSPVRGAEHVTVVMLPGAGDNPEDLIEQGFVRTLRERHLAVDAVIVDAHMDYYLKSNIVEHLEHDVIAPLHADGHSHLWFMGISLGGMGAMAYAREHKPEIEGMILLAPFIGTRGLVAEVEQAGGFDRWDPGLVPSDDNERQLLAWLQRCRADDADLPKIYLGYGTEDRFAPASQLLAQRLPSDHVVAIPGSHDWPTWRHLWAHFVDRLFSDRNADASAKALGGFKTGGCG